MANRVILEESVLPRTLKALRAGQIFSFHDDNQKHMLVSFLTHSQDLSHHYVLNLETGSVLSIDPNFDPKITLHRCVKILSSE
jgi:hypothetical protein